jgi:hypothetical protein
MNVIDKYKANMLHPRVTLSAMITLCKVILTCDHLYRLCVGVRARLLRPFLDLVYLLGAAGTARAD